MDRRLSISTCPLEAIDMSSTYKTKLITSHHQGTENTHNDQIDYECTYVPPWNDEASYTIDEEIALAHTKIFSIYIPNVVVQELKNQPVVSYKFILPNLHAIKQFLPRVVQTQY